MLKFVAYLFDSSVLIKSIECKLAAFETPLQGHRLLYVRIISVNLLLNASVLNMCSVPTVSKVCVVRYIMNCKSYQVLDIVFSLGSTECCTTDQQGSVRISQDCSGVAVGDGNVAGRRAQCLVAGVCAGDSTSQLLQLHFIFHCREFVYVCVT